MLFQGNDFFNFPVTSRIFPVFTQFLENFTPVVIHALIYSRSNLSGVPFLKEACQVEDKDLLPAKVL